MDENSTRYTIDEHKLAILQSLRHGRVLVTNGDVQACLLKDHEIAASLDQVQLALEGLKRDKLADQNSIGLYITGRGAAELKRMEAN